MIVIADRSIFPVPLHAGGHADRRERCTCRQSTKLRKPAIHECGVKTGHPVPPEMTFPTDVAFAGLDETDPLHDNPVRFVIHHPCPSFLFERALNISPKALPRSHASVCSGVKKNWK
jgi:hypothetical protein